MVIKSKKGWIRLVEVFIAILLIAGVLLVIASRNNTSNSEDFYSEMTQREIAILRDIELNDSLRTKILGVTPPVEWADFDLELQNRIIFLTPSNLECEAKICSIEESCTMTNSYNKNIYAESVLISADLIKYSPRILKLFCTEN